MFEKQQNPEELNKIMGIVNDKHDMLSYDNEETNNVQLEEEIHHQMNLIKLDDRNVLPLEEVRRKLDKKNMVKWLLKMSLTKPEKNLT